MAKSATKKNKSSSFDIPQEVLVAEARIRPAIRETPLIHSPRFSKLGECDLYFKLESLQHTGSFKARGAMNKILTLTPEQRTQGVVAASTGNHGLAVAHALTEINANGLIFVPADASPTKVEAIRRLGCEVRAFGRDGGHTEVHAREYAQTKGMVYVSPYNDPQVIGGQGTIGLELARQLEEIDTVFVALGGGGLIVGIAGYLKSLFPKLTTVGCSPRNSAVMVESIRAKKILELKSKPTLSDGTAGGIEPGAITFDLCRKLVNGFVVVSEEEIVDAMKLYMETHHQMLEGSAGVAVASYLKTKRRFKGKTVVVIICGANISLDTLKQIL